MDILFINATEALSMRKEVNGTLLLATKLLNAGFEVDILRFEQVEGFNGPYLTFIENMTREILARKPKCVSFYSLWPDYHIMLRLARELKQANPEIVTVFGGPQASCTAEITLKTMQFVDYVNTGEGENTVVPLFSGILRGEGDLNAIPGLHYRKEGKLFHNNELVPLCDLNELPYWDDRLLPPEDPEVLKDQYYFMPIDIGRGCPYSCTFCCTSYFWRRVYRMKGTEEIIADIKYYKEKYGIRSFWFTHDAFTVNRQLVNEICDRILEEKLDIVWRCSARLDCISEELILKMKQAGMVRMSFGVETGSPRMQKIINKHLDLKKAKGLVDFLLKEQIWVGLYFMYGFPQETEEDLNQTLEMAFSMIDAGVQAVSLFYCKFCPNTGLTEEFGDQLVFDENARMNLLGIYGYEEEKELLQSSRELFPFYFHLHTPVRDDYQYLAFLERLYATGPRQLQQLRRLYEGDNLRFYREFYDANRSWFEGDLTKLEEKLHNDPQELVLNLVRSLDHPKKLQLEDLLKLAYRTKEISRSKEDTQLRDTYRFNYVDLSMKKSIDQYGPGRTDILLEKLGGKFELKVLQIYWD